MDTNNLKIKTQSCQDGPTLRAEKAVQSRYVSGVGSTWIHFELYRP
jgi:hypothetical protein